MSVVYNDPKVTSLSQSDSLFPCLRAASSIRSRSAGVTLHCMIVLRLGTPEGGLPLFGFELLFFVIQKCCDFDLM